LLRGRGRRAPGHFGCFQAQGKNSTLPSFPVPLNYQMARGPVIALYLIMA